MQKMGRFLFFLFLGVVMANEMEDVRVKQTEMFSIAITPQMFNWTYQEFDKQYSFQTSLLNKPDLPSWLHYIYSVRHHSGFVYGTPPHDQKDIMIQTIALNRDDYETRRLIIPLHISRRENVATYQVQMKIDNLNVEDMLDEHRMERLKDVFRKKLWRDAEDMYTTFMASAIDLGARLPLRPSEGEGVVVKLGSHRPHSAELLQLQEEVKPLARMVWCPRDFKRTTVERLFRDAGFNLDWCAFKLVEVPNPYTSKPTNVNLLKYGATSGKLRNPESGAIEESPRPLPQWRAPTKAQVPQRGYAHEFTLSIILPLMVMVLLVSVLSLILCFQREGLSNCKKLRDHGKAKSSHVNSDGTAAPGSRPGSSSANLNTFLADDGSNKSNLGISPNNSLTKPRSNPNLEVDYNRPQPPPYLGSNTNSLVLRQRQTVDEDLAAKKSRARTLEESLQLLNEANIVHRNYNLDGMILPDRLLMGDLLLADCVAANAVDEDYVPIKNDHSHRRNNGLINNGVNNNNGVLKGVNGF